MTKFRKVEIGPATLYHANCLDVLPTLHGIDAVVTDPPYGIGYAYSHYDDSPDEYDALMGRLVPQCVRITGDGPCFVWQSLLKADRWHRYFPAGFRIIAGCKIYRPKPGKHCCYSWDPIIFWSSTSKLHEELPYDWHVADLTEPNAYPAGSPVACPRPLEQVRYIVESIRGRSILDPFLGSGTTGVAAVLENKRFVGIEQDAEAFEFACRRIANAWTRSQRGTTQRRAKIAG
jgi:site-specific DNA-methyltransferase (adenine-specific)/modification methylase